MAAHRGYKSGLSNRSDPVDRLTLARFKPQAAVRDGAYRTDQGRPRTDYRWGPRISLGQQPEDADISDLLRASRIRSTAVSGDAASSKYRFSGPDPVAERADMRSKLRNTYPDSERMDMKARLRSPDPVPDGMDLKSRLRSPDLAIDRRDLKLSLDAKYDDLKYRQILERGDFKERYKDAVVRQPTSREKTEISRRSGDTESSTFRRSDLETPLTSRRSDLNFSDNVIVRKNAGEWNPTKKENTIGSPDLRTPDPLEERFTSSLSIDLSSRNVKDAGIFTKYGQEPKKYDVRKSSFYGHILEVERNKEKEREKKIENEKYRKSERDSLESPGAKFTRPTSGVRDRSPSDRDKKKQVARKRKQPVTANMSGTRYDIVRYCAEKAGFVMAREDDMNSYLIWVDSFASTDRVAELKSYQRINHFPNMGEICRKDALCRNMARMAKDQPGEYNFIPRTWTFPSEYNTFMQYARDLKKKKKTKTFIVKPANGAMGNGIQLYRNPEKIPSNENFIVQEYLDKPFLIDGYKCDMRIYVLVTHCDPLRVFLFHDGLLRFGTEKYILPTDANIDQLYMHLTNYSINKHSDNYEKDDSVNNGTKRSLKFLNEYLRRHDYDVAFLWRNIVDVLVKTLIVGHPHVLHAYRMCRPGQPAGSDSVCFEILGFDILLDRKLKPWLLEVNRSPSFGTDEKIDHQIKAALLNDTFRLLNIKASDKRKNIAAQKADAQKRLFRPVKRVEKDTSEEVKRRLEVERRKEELKDLLKRVRRDASREEYENRNCGRFQRIFPPDDKFRQEKYTGLLSAAFSVFLSNRSGTLQREIELTYNNKLKEVDILDMLAQYESDEARLDPKRPVTSGRRISTGVRKPLTSLPTSQPERDDVNMSTDDESNTTPSRQSRPLSRSQSFKTIPMPKDEKCDAKFRSKSLTRPCDTSLTITALLNPRERDQDMLKNTLIALNEMRIRFPGKSNDEADLILDRILENWKFHKPRVASYWLVKLDSVKRRKVIDIVRSNVRSAIQRSWRVTDIDNLKITRIVGRVFNRLLWSHGQGLWNCFTTSGTSWEVIFSKSSDVISSLELNCCRRIVQLCKDCLLIVYQFASDAKAGTPCANPEPQNDRLRGMVNLSGLQQKME